MISPSPLTRGVQTAVDYEINENELQVLPLEELTEESDPPVQPTLYQLTGYSVRSYFF